MAKDKFNCECLKCGHKLESEKHCADLKCPKCGGTMRRQERPGPGRLSEVTPFGEVLFGEIDFDAPVEIFRAGHYPQGDISEADLETVLSNFNPDYHNPPVVKDHEESGPAFGWVKELWKEGKSLWARLRDIPKTVRAEIKEKAWLKISAAFYPDFEGRGLALRHISLLGACPPQVKGMKTWKDRHGAFMAFMEVEITDKDKEAQRARSEKYGISILPNGNVTKPQSYSDIPDEEWADPVNYRYPCSSEKGVRASIKWWAESEASGIYPSEDRAGITERLVGFAEKFKVEAKSLKDSEGTMELTEAKVQELLKKNSEAITAKFSDELKTFKEESDKQIKELKDENTKLKENQATNFSEAEKKEREKRVDELVDGLIKDGKITPAFVDAGLKKFFLELPEDKVIEMGEGDKATKVKLTDWAIDLFKNKIKGAAVHFGEVGKHPAGESAQAGMGTQFKVVESGEAITQDSLDVHDKTLAFMDEWNKAHPQQPVSYKDALLRVGGSQ